MTLTGTSSLLSAIAITFALAGCASTRSTGPSDAKEESARAKAAAGSKSTARADVNAASADAAAADAGDVRAVGDYVTYAFSGGYRKAPLRLSQRVVARDEATITIDYTFTESNKNDVLRVTLGTTKTTRGDVAKVERVRADGSTAAATKADFENKMAGTAAIADENEALVEETQMNVRVGEVEIPATRSLYKVRVGNKAATLETTTGHGFAWGDLGGKITTADGKVFFNAELVDAGGPSSARASLD